MGMLWAHSSLDRVRKCRRLTAGGQASLVKRETHAHFAGLQTCGSVWACPCCSERVLAARCDELVRAIETHAGRGGRVAMLTLTMRHNAGQTLRELWDALSPAWAAAVGGYQSSRDAIAAAGVEHWVRRNESTVGPNGWHLHPHGLLFLPADATHESVRELGEAMFEAWARKLVALGFDAPLRDSGGLDIKLLELDEAREEVAGYLAKGTYESVELGQARRAARELASNAGKRARRRENRSTMQLLADVVDQGEFSDLELWREWEQGSHNRRAMTWSNGARDALVGDVDELTDEEIAAANEGQGELVVTFGAEEWAAIRDRRRLPARLLEWVEDADDVDEAAWLVVRELRRHGLPPPRALRSG